MDAFDANALIYGASESNVIGRRVVAALSDPAASPVGSVLLLPEVLTKPMALGDEAVDRIEELLSRLELLPVTESIARTAVQLGARYGLKSVDAIHLATAVAAGADRFITNDARDFRSDLITEIAIVTPDLLPEG